MNKNKKNKIENIEQNNIVQQETNVVDIPATPESNSVETTQQVFTSKAAQKEHVKNMKMQLKQEALIERERIEAERIRLKQAILDIQAEIEKSKVKQAKVYEQAKFEEAKLIEEAIKNKRIEEEELRKRNELLRSRQKDITLLNEQHSKKQSLYKQEMNAKHADLNQKLKLSKLQIKEELMNQKRLAQQKEFEQRQLALELKQRLNQEKQELQLQKEEEKRLFRQEVAQMRLELYAEKNRQKQELFAKKMEAKNQKLVELEAVRQETEQLKSEREKAIEVAKLSRIKANLELEKRKNQLAQEIKEQTIEIETAREEQGAEIEAIKEINNIEVKAIIDANDVLIQKTTMIPVSEKSAEEIAAEREAQAIKVFKQDYVTLVSEFKGFDKKGEVELARIKKTISDAKLKKVRNHPYYGPMVDSYMKIQEEGNFIELEEIIRGGHIISEDEIHRELISTKVRTLQKAILQGIPIKVGNYYLMPVEKSGIHSFYISHHLKDGEVIFDNAKLFSQSTIRGMEEIVDFKFEQGASIKIVEGLAISNHDGNLAVAIYPNIIK